MKAKMDTYEGLGTPDEKKEQKVSEKSKGLLQKLDDLLGYPEDSCASILDDTVTDVLTSEEINGFLQATSISIEQMDRTDFFHHQARLGYMLTHLIGLSYKCGNNRFSLDMPTGSEITGLGYALKATWDNPLYLTVQGLLSNNAGDLSKHCNYEFNDYVGSDAGRLSENCTFRFKDGVDDEVGAHAKNCTFTFDTGHTSSSIALKSRNCTFYFNGKFWDDIGHKARGCTFYATHEESYYKFLDRKATPDPQNVLILTDEQGKEIDRVKF